MTPSFDEKSPSIKDAEKLAVQHQSTCVDTTPPSAASDEYLVTWAPDDAENPLNWSLTRKWIITILISLGGTVALMSATMLAPALTDIAADLHTGPSETNMTLSIFLLAIALGPMVLAPCTEVFGRRNIWLMGSLWYLVWNTVCGFAHNRGLLLAGRLLSGLGTSVEYAVTQPLLSDCWRPEQRGQSFAIATFLPLLGPALGPIVSGFITASVGWRWLFWTLSIFDACLIIAAFFFLPETYDQILLHRRARSLRRQTGKPYHTQWDQHFQPLSRQLKTSIARPCLMLATRPIVQLMSVFLAYNFGTLFFVLSTFASIWQDTYHESTATSGLHYIALVLGYTIASQLGGWLTDRLWRHLQTAASGHTVPEYRVPLMLPGTILMPTGLFWYGWAAQATCHWALVDAGLCVFACGITVSTQAMQQYVIECFRGEGYVASATAASQFLRCVFAFCFPLFAPALYAHLGLGWGNSVLALVFLALGIPAPFILWKYGARLRAMGRHMP